MKLKELREKSDAELQKLLKSFRESLREMHFKVANDQMKNVRSIRVTKKDIARILTLIKERQSKQLSNQK